MRVEDNVSPVKRLLSLSCLLLLAAPSAFGDDLTRSVQNELKNQGFYYGDLDGRAGPELTAALRRYQIRYGLGVTGDLDKETLGALHIAGSAPKPKAPPPAVANEAAPSAPHPAAPRPPPVNLRRADESAAPPTARTSVDEPSPAPRYRGPAVVPPPAPLDPSSAIASPAGPYAKILAGTPYADSSASVQQSTVRRAEEALAGKGIYRDEITGQPGPALEEALLTYQRSQRLRLTGRLDALTLSALRLLPERTTGANPLLKPFSLPGEPVRRQVYRGVWVE